MFSKLKSSAQNIVSTTADELVVSSAQTITPNGDLEFSIKIENGKKCKILLDCDNANKMVNELKMVIKQINNTYTTSMNQLTELIKSDTTSLTSDTMPEFIKKTSEYKTTMDNIIKIKENSRKTEYKPTQTITVNVFVKGMADKQVGQITSFNVNNKDITVTYKNMKNMTETLRNIKISLLCINSNDCVIKMSGGGKYKMDELEQTDGYQIVCE